MSPCWYRRAETRRGSALSGSLVVATLAAGCATGSPSFPTASSHDDTRRRPDGVAVDLESGPPRVRIHASDGDGIVTLRAPLAAEAALATVRDFFVAVVHEDAGMLGNIAQSGALVRAVRGESTKAAQAVQAWWQQRFRKYDYGRLRDFAAYREADIETYRADALGSLPVAPGQLNPDGEAVEDEDLFLRVPITLPGVRIDRLFGDEIYFWLRRVGERYLVHHLAEDFDL